MPHYLEEGLHYVNALVPNHIIILGEPDEITLGIKHPKLVRGRDESSLPKRAIEQVSSIVPITETDGEGVAILEGNLDKPRVKLFCCVCDRVVHMYIIPKGG